MRVWTPPHFIVTVIQSGGLKPQPFCSRSPSTVVRKECFVRHAPDNKITNPPLKLNGARNALRPIFLDPFQLALADSLPLQHTGCFTSGNDRKTHWCAAVHKQSCLWWVALNFLTASKETQPILLNYTFQKSGSALFSLHRDHITTPGQAGSNPDQPMKTAWYACLSD